MGLKLTIELPDWCDERHIYIVAGIDVVAYKLYGEDVLHVKETRCAMCGECCRRLSVHDPLVGENGTCKHLGTGGVANECGLGQNRPAGCGMSLTQKGEQRPYCSIVYKREKI